ncbi:hypothetical protein LTS18_008001, partial [Coniosporium uncinatum]
MSHISQREAEEEKTDTPRRTKRRKRTNRQFTESTSTNGSHPLAGSLNGVGPAETDPVDSLVNEETNAIGDNIRVKISGQAPTAG